MDNDTLIIIPAYNEAAGIAKLIADIKVKAPGMDIAVVDDGSADGTAAQAKGAGAAVIRHPFNLGYGAGLQTVSSTRSQTDTHMLCRWTRTASTSRRTYRNCFPR